MLSAMTIAILRDLISCYGMSMPEDFLITAEMLTAATASPAQPCAAKGALVWLEREAAKQGRYNVIFLSTANFDFADEALPPRIGLLPEGYAVASRVHEYGGRAVYLECTYAGENYNQYLLVFSSAIDQRLYAVDIFCVSGGRSLSSVGQGFGVCQYYESLPGCDIYWTHPLPLTPASDSLREYRFACPVLHRDKKHLFAVCEKHLWNEKESVVNTVVAVPVDGSACDGEDKIAVIGEGSDFYAFLTVSETGQYLSYITWDHPDMPWDHARLVTNQIEFENEKISVKSSYDLHRENFSITQPYWGSNDTLLCISDISGWGNLYRVAGDKFHYSLQPICEEESDFAKPDWVIGKYSYAECGDNKIAAVYTKDNIDYLLLVDHFRDEKYLLHTPYTEFDWLTSDGDVLYFLAASPCHLPSLCALRIGDGKIKQISANSTIMDSCGRVTRGERYEFAVGDGTKVFALIYRPSIDHDKAALPPLLINVHGGPTGSVSDSLDLSKQFWTGRGFLVADLDFRGSTGHGRTYRKQIDWGKTDTEDAVGLAVSLCEDGLADRNKIFIRGKSSGGFTVLSSLWTTDIFAGGVSYYGVYDLLSLTTDTHKFESHYFETLIGKLPESEETYKERSVINKVSSVNAPVLLFHGEKDQVVPIGQTLELGASLYAQGKNCELFTFENEGHGFRDSRTIQFCHLAEFRFYQSVLKNI